jgi:hypothetical protein
MTGAASKFESGPSLPSPILDRGVHATAHITKFAKAAIFRMGVCFRRPSTVYTLIPGDFFLLRTARDQAAFKAADGRCANAGRLRCPVVRLS